MNNEQPEFTNSEFMFEFIKAAQLMGLSQEEIEQDILKIAGVGIPEPASVDKPVEDFTKTPVGPDNQRVIDKLKHQPGIVASWNMGSGKSKLSIDAYKQLGLPTNVIVPASLKGNYRKELDKWIGHQPEDITIESQQRLARGGKTQTVPGGFEILDESHHARNNQSKLLDALKQSQAAKRLLLTGTPVTNSPSDISPLVNLAAGKNVLPGDPTRFNKRYVEQKPIKAGLLGSIMGVKPGTEEKLTNTNELSKILGQYVDYKEGQKEGFPSHTEQEINVPMQGKQNDIYNTIMGTVPSWVRWKVKRGLPPNKAELSKLQAFLTGARQVSNSTYDFVQDKNKAVSPKIYAAANFLKQQVAQNPNYKGVVYSNYLDSALTPYKNQLDKFNIPYGEFTGDINPKVRDQMVKDYNVNKLKALLISSAGAEGLDLKGTRLLQILEPHFNSEKEKQIEGRAIRYKSHAALPPDEQNVLIQRYFARPQGNWWDRTMGRATVPGTDQYVADIAKRKQKLNEQLLDILRENASKY